MYSRVCPLWLWLLALLPFLAVLFFASERWRAGALGRLIAMRLQPRLAGSVSVVKRRISFALLVAGLAMCVLALARPRWGFAFEQVTGRGRDIIIAVDTSRSMLAQDIDPSRLARAKLAAQDLLANLDGDRVGLVAFAGTAFLQAPLTPDYGAVRESLNELDTEIIPQGGTNLSAAIAAADEAFGKGESTHRAMILFTDGEDLQEDAVESAKKHKDTFRIFTIGLGTNAGAPIVVPSRKGREILHDEQGNIVTSRLDEKRLREVAEAGGGFYIHLQNGPAEMRQLVRDGLGSMKEKDTDQRTNKVAIERYQWPLAIGLALVAASALLGERRRVVMRAAAVLWLAISPASAHADGDAALQQLEAARDKRPGVPQLDYNVGCSAFKTGDYDKAAASFSNALGTGDAALKSKAAYNLANTLARRGAVQKEKEPKLAEWKSALQNYDHALALDPANTSAKENRDIVSKAIEELEKPDEKKDDQKKDGEKKEGDKKDGDKKDGDKKDGDEKDGDKKNGDKKDGDKKDGDEKEGDKKDGEKKDGEKPDKKQGDPKDQQNPSQQQKDGDKKGDEKDEPKTQPKSDEKEKPKKGELKNANEPQPGDKDAQQGEAAEAAQAAREGRMTEKDAKQLLESLRKNDVILPPLKLLEERQTPHRVQKNW